MRDHENPFKPISEAQMFLRQLPHQFHALSRALPDPANAPDEFVEVEVVVAVKVQRKRHSRGYMWSAEEARIDRIGDQPYEAPSLTPSGGFK